MTTVLIRKLVRDLRWPLLIICLLLAAFECLWAKITQRITTQLLPLLLWLAAGRNASALEVEEQIFGGPGKILKTLLGGESISIFNVQDMLSIGFVEPVVLVLFCIWTIGHSASAITGELDRGTLELLLAQPLRRSQIILAHFCIDCLTIPLLCLSLWGGLWLGIRLNGLDQGTLPIDPLAFGPPMWNVAAFLFAVSGYTLWLSASGRFRTRVLGIAALVTLLQMLVNLMGQLLDEVAFLRPFTVFYYYQPQQIIKGRGWTMDLHAVWGSNQPFGAVNILVVLFGVGLAGYALAWHKFCRRDLPAPL
jgi:ABC-2 type transport system permease protein